MPNKNKRNKINYSAIEFNISTEGKTTATITKLSGIKKTINLTRLNKNNKKILSNIKLDLNINS